MTARAIYLDYAAATPVDKRVLAAMQPYFSEDFFNPSATYLAAKRVKADIEAARAMVGGLLGAKPSEIIFTAGGTEANNLAIFGIMSQFPEGNLVYSAIEHESVREPAKQFASREAGVNKDGLVDLADLERKIDDKTVLISIMYANNEIGTIQNLREIATLLQSFRKARQTTGNELPLYFHTDAAQAGNYLDLHVSRLGVDLMTLNGGKIYGPKQSGCLFVKTGVILEPLVRGGGQERNLRSGTENVAAVVGFATALELAQQARKDESRRLQQLQKNFIDQLGKMFPQAYINGSLKHRLPNNINVTFPGQDNERLLMQLDEAGIQCASGSACSASKDESSHVLRALGLLDEEARATLRLSLGRETTQKQLTSVAMVIRQKVIENL